MACRRRTASHLAALYYSSNIMFIMLWLQLGGIPIPCLGRRTTTKRCMDVERDALLAFKASIMADPHHLLSSWHRQTDCCSRWRGVVCDNTTGHVVQLNLQNPNSSDWGCHTAMKGKMLSQSLLSLTHLDLLNLSCNDFSRIQIPGFMGFFNKLRYLDLSKSNFSGSIPHQLANLSTTLLHLDLSNNDFGGIPVPKFLGSLKKMRHLDLSRSNFDGAIPPQLANLSALRHLDLSYNFITIDDLEWLSHFSSLRFLDLSYAYLSNEVSHNWLPQVNMLSSLRELHLRGCGFDIIPSSFPYVNLTTLNTLDLNGNYFNSTLPNWLWDINSLSHLDLSLNSFTGPLPAKIRKLSNLLYLDLSHNSLQGDVSEIHFANLTSLETLYLSGNSLTVTIDDDWKPDPFQLKYLGLGSCKLGPHFPGWLRWQRSILDLDLSNTSIESTLPGWFWNSWPNIRGLDVSQNQISGTLPVSLEGMTTLRFLKMGSNMLRGQVPALPHSLEILDLSGNFLSGPLPPTLSARNLTYLILSNNHISGSMPSYLQDLTNLEFLDLSDNQISGGIPQSTWKSSNLGFLNLANNKLSGPIPISITNFQPMQYLLLNDNSLSGELPPTLQNCTWLSILDLGENKLSGNIPAWIGESLQDLGVLRLRSNMFSGNIPPQLGQLKELQIVDLANNQLSGSIPRSFGNFSAIIDKSIIMSWGNTIFIEDSATSSVFISEIISVVTKGQTLAYSTSSELGLVKSIDLSNNHLTGEIPEELGALVALQTLNLSKNNLQGKISDTIGKMQSLQTLDLSFNDLSGAIPQSLSMLNFLSSLNVSYNNLSGMIPSGNQLQTLDDPYIYVGNAYLCGPPVSKSCSPVIAVVDEEPKNESEMKWLYLSVVLGFVVGLWGVFVVLLYHRAWRFYYFRMIDDTYDKLNVAVAIYLAKRRNRGSENGTSRCNG